MFQQPEDQVRNQGTVGDTQANILTVTQEIELVSWSFPFMFEKNLRRQNWPTINYNPELTRLGEERMCERKSDVKSTYWFTLQVAVTATLVPRAQLIATWVSATGHVVSIHQATMLPH